MARSKPSLLQQAPRSTPTFTAMPDDPGVLEVAIERIKSRAHQDLRELNVEHSIDLAETIAAVGLLEPIVIDTSYRLLAGLHRLAACQLIIAVGKMNEEQLAKEIPAVAATVLGPGKLTDSQIVRIRELDTANFEKIHPRNRIPARMMPFDAERDGKRALEVEVAENEKRRDFSQAEIEKIVARLKDRGFTEVKGRPAPGVQPLNPMLRVILGKSRRHVSRLLNGGSKKPAVKVSSPESYLPQLARAIDRAMPELKASKHAQWKAAAQYFEKGHEMLTELIKQS